MSVKDRPGLAILQVADNPASHVYVKAKLKQAESVGIFAHHIHLDEKVSQSHIFRLIDQLNADESIHGIIVQLPLPAHLDTLKIANRIHPEKDVDGLSVTNVGNLTLGLPGLVPCTPLGCLILLTQVVESLEGKHAVIIGRSNLVGKPMAQLLLQKNCTVTIVHSKSENPEKITNQADVVIAAVGRPKLITDAWIKEGAVVLDVGINRADEEGLLGDVDFERVKEKVSNITPVPGGVGPMTVACLLLNTVLAMSRQKGIKLKYLPENLLGEKLCL